MKTGQLDRLVTIVAPVKPSTTDEWNEATGPAPTRTQAWAAIKTAPGVERFQSGENLALAPLRFFFRWRKDLVRPDFSIEYDGLTFDVKSVEEIGRRELLQVGAVARVVAPVA